MPRKYVAATNPARVANHAATERHDYAVATNAVREDSSLTRAHVSRVFVRFAAGMATTIGESAASASLARAA